MKLPAHEDVTEIMVNNERQLNPVEQFIIDHEPIANDQEWRESLHAALLHARSGKLWNR